MTSIFDQVGGASAVSAVVDEFYRRVVADPRLVRYFADTDLGKLKAHQRSFVSAALGGPQEYRGRTMGEAHAGMGITGEEFDAVVVHLAGALTQYDVPEPTITTIAGALAPLKGQIVGSELPAL
ncbi:group 1 truncated hemoglobin [Nonomuraea antimicrobica]|uniref:Group 1 truncated hemoglobin n=1 Tax=Nonomuraea antimicrobica TaxID=561173 RepID=A0ABP7BBY4_9ACTN